MADSASGETRARFDAHQFQAWLAENHAGSNGIWLLIQKKGSAAKSLTIGEALDVALCFGWIDSQRKSYDGDFYLQRYSRRRTGSPWSRLNVLRVEALADAGRMQAPGLAEVATAQADGRWAIAYQPQRDAELAPDIVAALKDNAPAAAAFERLDKTGRYAVFLPVLKAVTPEIRAARLGKAIARLTS
ncbi:OmdA domain containing protein [Sphingomonas sp. So64.6b]|uniref:YdeI/OmpD-associated family protein n=1 Tax=Sphingomonas sp. So64.6b TaxID=2997354 RepID=UPI0016049158|nr:YdeI/OmpD-associated family protein [Sphingomonas sp. So64.6b]QNA86228.1 OmdA domain containing protein [Sphingomonas sp. So64.6b]